MTTAPRPATAGERVLVLEDGIAIRTGWDQPDVGWRVPRDYVAARGSVFTLTGPMLAASKDRNGASPFDLLHSPEAQQAKWGTVRYRALGDDEEPPEEYRTPEPGSVRASLAYDAERLRIVQEVGDEGERRRQLRALRERLAPPSGQTSTFIRGESGVEELDRPRRADEVRRA